MLAVLVNTLAVLLGSTVGLLARKGIPEKVSGAIMTAISLCTLYAGVSGMLKGENTLVLIVSMVLGTAAGTLLDLDGALARLGKAIESRFRRTDGKTSVAEGFVTASLLFCIGAMTFVGCINAGLRQDYELLFTKSLLDCISSCMLSVTLGIGVLCSAGFVLVFQGGDRPARAGPGPGPVRRGHRGADLLRLGHDRGHQPQHARPHEDQDR